MSERIEVQIIAYRVPEVEGKLQTLQKRMEKKGLAGMVDYTVGPVEMRVVREGKDGASVRLLVSLGKNQFGGLNVAVGDSVVMSISHADVHVMQD